MTEKFDLFAKIADKKLGGIALINKTGTVVTVFAFGATINKIMTKGKNDVPKDILLGYDEPKDYEANDGVWGSFTNGEDDSWSRSVWDMEVEGETAVFTLHLEEADVTVRYTLDDDGALTIEQSCAAKGVFWFDPSIHCLFNLSGHRGGSVADHWVKIDAPGEGLYDFSNGRVLGNDIYDDSLRQTGGFEAIYGPAGEGLRHVAAAKSLATGIKLDVLTDRPALYFHTANRLTQRAGKLGAVYDKNGGLAFETIGAWPETLGQGDTFTTKTVYKFSHE